MPKPKNERYTVAVDFDGVLHSYTSPWTRASEIPDPPVPGAIEWLKKIQEKMDVVIFTTRGSSIAGRWAVRCWLWRYGYSEPGAEAASDLKIVITYKKIPALVYIDDRGYRFEGTFPSAGEIHRLRPWNKKPNVEVAE